MSDDTSQRTSTVSADERPKLSVVISAGQPRDCGTRFREIAVFLHDLTEDQLKQAVLKVYSDAQHSSQLASLKVYPNIYERDGSSARIFTGLKFGKTYYTAENHPTDDIGYFTTVSINGDVLGKGSLKVEPQWMESLLKQGGGKLRLAELAIPGTHDAGTYKEYNGQNPVNKYRDCQEEDIFTQLLYGMRFIDLRPAAIKKKNAFEFWIYHGRFATKNRLEKILLDVKKFIDLYTNEVVFIDFHEYSVGFNIEGSYDALAKLVVDILGDRMLGGSPVYTTLKEAVSSGKRAVVSFDKNDVLRRNYNPGVSHIWGNTDDLQKLKSFIKNKQIERQGWIFSAMAEITPQGVWNLIIDSYRGGVRGIAHKHNFFISGWYRSPGAIRDNANIIAVDYFTSTDIVDICKDINLERSNKRK